MEELGIRSSTSLGWGGGGSMWAKEKLLSYLPNLENPDEILRFYVNCWIGYIRTLKWILTGGGGEKGVET